MPAFIEILRQLGTFGVQINIVIWHCKLKTSQIFLFVNFQLFWRHLQKFKIVLFVKDFALL